MTDRSPAEHELAELLITALNIEHLQPDTVDPEATMFGADENGWGLDSIDALEIALAVQQKYGVELRSEDEEVKPAFASLRSLTRLVMQRRG